MVSNSVDASMSRLLLLSLDALTNGVSHLGGVSPLAHILSDLGEDPTHIHHCNLSHRPIAVVKSFLTKLESWHTAGYYIPKGKLDHVINSEVSTPRI